MGVPAYLPPYQEPLARIIPPLPFYSIADDSLFLKAICCIPLIGDVFHVNIHLALININSAFGSYDELLARKNVEELNNAIKLKKVITDYAVVGAVRSMLSIALVVAGVYFNLLFNSYVLFTVTSLFAVYFIMFYFFA